MENEKMKSEEDLNTSEAIEHRDNLLKKRVHVIREIVSTEKVYISRLKIVLEVFAVPLKPLKIIDSQEYANQFDILVMIYSAPQLISSLTFLNSRSDYLSCTLSTMLKKKVNLT
jgi:hypothetical protein